MFIESMTRQASIDPWAMPCNSKRQGYFCPDPTSRSDAAVFTDDRATRHLGKVAGRWVIFL